MRQLLEQIGLTRGECEVYEALVKLGQSNVTTLIKHANLASSKAYDVLHRLHIKGLASFVIKNGVKFYDATPPERLLDFVTEKKDRLDALSKKIKKELPAIKAARKSVQEQNHVTTYTGLEGPKIVLRETIEAGRNGAELLGFGSDEDPYKDHLPYDIENHFREQKKYDVHWKLLFAKSPWKSPAPLSEIRYLPKGFNLPIRTIVYGDKVAIVDFNKPVTTIIIQKKEIVKAYTDHFKYLWGIAKP
jgi:sugar-specific transcriptional regulator TrmB